MLAKRTKYGEEGTYVAMNTLDTLERRDRWRSAWEAATSGAVLATLVVVVFVVGAALTFLPQAPDVYSGTSVEQWRALARLRLGGWFAPLDIFGLFDVRGTRWLQLPVILLAVMVMLRMLERMARFGANSAAQTVADGRRVRVTDSALDFENVCTVLRARRYRTRVDGPMLLATRAPWAETASLVMHAGLLVCALALLADIHFGWDVAGVRVVSGGERTAIYEGYSVSMPDVVSQNDETAKLRIDPGGQLVAPEVDGSAIQVVDVRVALRSISSGYYVSAKSVDGQTLIIRTSNYLSPTEIAAVDFRDEDGATVAVPEANVVLTLLHAPSGGPDQLRVYSVGAAEKVVFGLIEPQMTIGDVVLEFSPLVVAELDASRRPGAVAAAIGLVLACAGAALGLRWPMRRIVVRRSEPWIEIFADGRGVYADVTAASAGSER